MALLAAVLFLFTGSAGYYCSASIRHGDLMNLPDAWRSEPFVNLILVASVALLVAGLVTAFLPRIGSALAFSASGSLAFLLFVALLGCMRGLVAPESPGGSGDASEIGIVVIPLMFAVGSLAAARAVRSADN